MGNSPPWTMDAFRRKWPPVLQDPTCWPSNATAEHRSDPVWIGLLKTKGHDWVAARIERLAAEAERRRLRLPPEPADDSDESDFFEFRSTD